MHKKYRFLFFGTSLAFLVGLLFLSTGDASGNAAPNVGVASGNQSSNTIISGGGIVTANLWIRRVSSGGGIVTGEYSDTNSSGIIDCGPTCSYDIISGSSIRLSGKPAPGYKFIGWSGDIISQSKSVEFVLNQNKAVTANFVRAKDVHSPKKVK